MEDKIRQILLDMDFVESDQGNKFFEIKDGILTVTISKPSLGETVNEEIRQTREYLLKHIDAKLITLCTIDDTGGILMLEKEKIGEINRIDGIMEINLDKLINSLSAKA